MVLSDRRQLITGLISFVVAPAIVRASSLMPVKAIDLGVSIGGITQFYNGKMIKITEYLHFKDKSVLFIDHINGIREWM